MKVKLFMTDIDSTVIKKGECLSQKVIDLPVYLASEGISFCYNTARSYLRARDAFKNITTSAPNVLSMGSEYRDSQGKLVHIEYLPAATKDAIMDVILEAKVESALVYLNGEINPIVFAAKSERLKYLSNKYYVNNSARFIDKSRFLMELKTGRPSVCVLRILETDVSGFEEALNRYRDSFEVNNVEYGTYIITKRGVHKGYGVQIVADILGIDNNREVIITAGDHYTDESMYITTTGIHVGDDSSKASAYVVPNTDKLIEIVYKLTSVNKARNFVFDAC